MVLSRHPHVARNYRLLKDRGLGELPVVMFQYARCWKVGLDFTTRESCLEKGGAVTRQLLARSNKNG